ncbi:NAD(P)-dependent alcohol dehydrogenase [uncultured Pseudodesulfovibrio sp.]|uniref:NAD(P)-dependent alcohol dehydrogenase n=1 Tax=uncultured Pseudodesulfovibrio sp. TaxID=2035858 RepID=UPI0029C63E5F|nr:NAD(P)-dependent alcohol dehydrogenase [uncultured Pseudodesulfovibrio sp.]
MGNGPYSIKAYGVDGPTDSFHAMTIERRALRPDDVLIDIMYCGICHSDIHMARSEWGPANYPCVPGHEIIGRVAAVGSKVKKFKVDDFAGVGCIVDSCGTCECCEADLEQYCPEWTLVFNAPDKISGGYNYGGFSDKLVVKEHYAIRVPPGVDLPAMAPLLCAGITTFSPIQHWKVESGQRVGVIGLGGLGHMAVKLAVSRKAEVTVFTTSPGKVAAAKELGAREAVLWSDTDAMERLTRHFDLMISTVPKGYPVNQFLNLLQVNGTLVNVGALDQLEDIPGMTLTSGRRSLAGSVIGGIAETQEVMDYCTAHNIKADIELIQPDQITEAFDRVVNKDIRYRFVIDLTGKR